MKWHLETWRKLYVAKSPAWLRLPVSARGLGRELLTYCDDAGRIDIGTDAPGEAIAYLLGARPKEHKRIAEDVAALLADGYLLLQGTDLVIRNFVEAQDRTPAAKRTAEWRARKNGAPASRGDAPRTVTGDVTCDARGTSPEPSPETVGVTATRSVPLRAAPTRDEDHPEPSPPPSPSGGLPGIGGDGAVGALVAALRAHRKFAGLDHVGIARDLAEAIAGAQMSAPKQRPAKTAVQLAEDVAAAAFELPEGPNEETVRRKLRAFVVNGGWGPRGAPAAGSARAAYRGREPSPQHTVTPEYLEREAKAQAARRAEIEVLDAAERARPPHERDPFGPDWEPPPEDSDA